MAKTLIVSQAKKYQAERALEVRRGSGDIDIEMVSPRSEGLSNEDIIRGSTSPGKQPRLRLLLSGKKRRRESIAGPR
jgi:hypothetical protein